MEKKTSSKLWIYIILAVIFLSIVGYNTYKQGKIVEKEKNLAGRKEEAINALENIFITEAYIEDKYKIRFSVINRSDININHITWKVVFYKNGIPVNQEKVDNNRMMIESNGSKFLSKNLFSIYSLQYDAWNLFVSEINGVPTNENNAGIAVHYLNAEKQESEVKESWGLSSGMLAADIEGVWNLDLNSGFAALTLFPKGKFSFILKSNYKNRTIYGLWKLEGTFLHFMVKKYPGDVAEELLHELSKSKDESIALYKLTSDFLNIKFVGNDIFQINAETLNFKRGNLRQDVK